MPIRTCINEFSFGHVEFGVPVRPPGENIQQAGNGYESEGWKKALSQRDGF